MSEYDDIRREQQELAEQQELLQKKERATELYAQNQALRATVRAAEAERIAEEAAFERVGNVSPVFARDAKAKVERLVATQHQIFEELQVLQAQLNAAREEKLTGNPHAHGGVGRELGKYDG